MPMTCRREGADRRGTYKVKQHQNQFSFDIILQHTFIVCQVQRGYLSLCKLPLRVSSVLCSICMRNSLVITQTAVWHNSTFNSKTITCLLCSDLSHGRENGERGRICNIKAMVILILLICPIKMSNPDVHKPTEHSPERDSWDLQTRCSDDIGLNYQS